MISDSYRAQLAQLHSERPDFGTSSVMYAPIVEKLIATYTLIPDKHNWRFSDAFPRMSNQHFFHQKGRSWKDVIAQVAKEVKHGLA